MAAVVVSEKAKKLRGTDQPCRVLRQISASDKTLTTDPPPHLTQDAKNAWVMAIECSPPGHLTALDATVLERWARNYALYRKVSKALEHDGVTIIDEETGKARTNPLLNASIKIQQILAACEKELGFTPVSRARVRRTDEEGKDEGGDFADF